MVERWYVLDRKRKAALAALEALEAEIGTLGEQLLTEYDILLGASKQAVVSPSPIDAFQVPSQEVLLLEGEVPGMPGIQMSVTTGTDPHAIDEIRRASGVDPRSSAAASIADRGVADLQSTIALFTQSL